jgi:hypothetical protein
MDLIYEISGPESDSSINVVYEAYDCKVLIIMMEQTTESLSVEVEKSGKIQSWRTGSTI